MIISAGKTEIFKFATPVGVGLIECSVNLTKICSEQKPKELIFVGSVGSYGELNIFELFTSYKAANVEQAALEEKAYTPISSTVESLSKNMPKKSLVVNSSNYITTDEANAKAFLKSGLDAENMEFFAVLSVAKSFNIPAFGAFVVTNYCDKLAHDDYMKNIKIAKEILSSFYEEKFEL
jgi:purine-nucleoside phosphorylase